MTTRPRKRKPPEKEAKPLPNRIFQLPAYIIAGATVVGSLAYLATAGIAGFGALYESDRPPVAGIARVEGIKETISKRLEVAEDFQMAATNSFNAITEQLTAQAQMARQAVAERKTERMKTLQAALDIAKTKAASTHDQSDQRIADALQVQLDDTVRDIQASQGK